MAKSESNLNLKTLSFVLLALAWLMSVLPASAQENVSIQFIKPGDRRNVALGELDVTVAVTGVNLDEDYTWQVFIDGVPQQVVGDSPSTRVLIDKPTGPRRLKAVLYDAKGAPVASNEILVIAAPIESHAEVFNRAWFVPFMAVFTAAILAIILLGLRLRPRTAA